VTFSSRLEKGPRLNSQSILPSTSFALAPQALSLAPTPFCHINHLSERVDETKKTVVRSRLLETEERNFLQNKYGLFSISCKKITASKTQEY
jgi:hypothetical protein